VSVSFVSPLMTRRIHYPKFGAESASPPFAFLETFRTISVPILAESLTQVQQVTVFSLLFLSSFLSQSRPEHPEGATFFPLFFFPISSFFLST